MGQLTMVDLDELGLFTWEGLESLVRDHVVEGVWFEAKGGQWLKDARGRDLPKKQQGLQLCEWILGFANADGGYLVWGVEAKERKTDKKDECLAIDGVPELDVSGLEKRVHQFLLTAAIPALLRLPEVVVVSEPEVSEPRRVVVIRVLPSPRGLHAIRRGNQLVYPARVGDRTLPLDAWAIQGLMYGRQIEPAIDVQVNAHVTNGTDQECELGLEIQLENVGLSVVPIERVGLAHTLSPSRGAYAGWMLARQVTNRSERNVVQQDCVTPSFLRLFGSQMVRAGVVVPTGYDRSFSAELALFVVVGNGQPMWWSISVEYRSVGRPWQSGEQGAVVVAAKRVFTSPEVDCHFRP